MLNNLKTSLEDNRAHLRRQLMAKESEVSRMRVQLKNLNRKFDRAQIEIELLRENRERAGLSALKFSEPKSSSLASFNIKTANAATSSTSLNYRAANAENANPKQKRGIKLCRQVYNLEEILSDPLKTRLYIEKLNAQIKERVISKHENYKN
jgi:hypothetical protein